VQTSFNLSPLLRVQGFAFDLLDAFAHLRAVAGVILSRTRDADDGELVGQQPLLAEVVDRGQELAAGQVARGAEDDDDAAVGSFG
jgi:hypothetical protein